MSAVATTARPRRVTARAIEGQELVLLGVLAVLWLMLSLAVDTFFTASTLQNLMAAVALDTHLHPTWDEVDPA